MRWTTHRFELDTGVLSLDVPVDARPDAFFQVAARRNPKRGFLFVSTLLGKHLPAPVPTMRDSYERLAERVHAEVKGDVLVIGMAETATLLGFGVYDSLARRRTGDRTFFVHSTRYRLGPDACSFEESHSHAPQQWLHGLDDARLRTVRQVVLVDDELSTGNTFLNLEAVLRERLPALKRTVWCCLTDFRSDAVRAEQVGRPVVALLHGSWSFEWTQRPTAVPSAEGRPVCPSVLLGGARGDALTRRVIEYDGVPLMTGFSTVYDRLDALQLHGRVLVLGTGEFMPLPWSLAETLQQQPEVRSVAFQATTRSPALMPGLGWREDHYGEGIPHYLYNHHPEHYDHTLLCVETPLNAQVQAMAESLGAHPVSFHPSAA